MGGVDEEEPSFLSVSSGYEMEQTVPTFSYWQYRNDESCKSMVTATFTVATFNGTIWVVQHKTPLGTIREEVHVFLKNWERVIGDDLEEKPKRRKSPASMTLKERLNLANKLVEAVTNQLSGRAIEIPSSGQAAVLLLRVRRMWLVVERARSVLKSTGGGYKPDYNEITKLRTAVNELDQVPGQ